MPDILATITKTASELLFEGYLKAHGHADWAHEPAVEGKVKNPDYHLKAGGSTYLFEIKEFERQPPVFEPQVYDPYSPVREKINQAARQFKEYKEFPCSIVVANPHLAFVQLDDPLVVIGSMCGNLGF